MHIQALQHRNTARQQHLRLDALRHAREQHQQRAKSCLEAISGVARSKDLASTILRAQLQSLRQALHMLKVRSLTPDVCMTSTLHLASMNVEVHGLPCVPCRAAYMVVVQMHLILLLHCLKVSPDLLLSLLPLCCATCCTHEQLAYPLSRCCLQCLCCKESQASVDLN